MACGISKTLFVLLQLGDVLNALESNGFFDHVKLLVLRTQSHAPLSSHIFHPSVLHIDSGYVEFLASS